MQVVARRQPGGAWHRPPQTRDHQGERAHHDGQGSGQSKPLGHGRNQPPDAGAPDQWPSQLRGAGVDEQAGDGERTQHGGEELDGVARHGDAAVWRHGATTTAATARSEAGRVGAPVAVVTTVQGAASNRPMICRLGRMVESIESACAAPYASGVTVRT